MRTMSFSWELVESWAKKGQKRGKKGYFIICKINSFEISTVWVIWLCSALLGLKKNVSLGSSFSFFVQFCTFFAHFLCEMSRNPILGLLHAYASVIHFLRQKDEFNYQCMFTEIYPRSILQVDVYYKRQM